MKVIIPMAGRGSRLRPHTLTVPKPLIPIAGKPIVHRLVEDIIKLAGQEVDEVAFIIGDFGSVVEQQLKDIAASMGAKGSVYHQEEPLGTAHAILCAKEALEGNVVIAFADTLFRANFELDTQSDGVIWTKKVANPEAFGVVKKDEHGHITEFIEKPKEFVSDEAIIGIYYFRDGAYLRDEMQYLIDNKITDKGEYQITDALENMKKKGAKFTSGTVSEWMDCGNKNVTVETNGKILGFVHSEEQLISPEAHIDADSKIIEPCYIAQGAKIINSTVGPRVSIGANSVVENSQLSDVLIQEESQVLNANLTNSMIGNKAKFDAKFKEISIGDYSTLE